MSTVPPGPPPQYPIPRAGGQPIVPTPPSKKGNLVLYIGGGCLLLLVLALVTCSVGLRSCARFVSGNPAVLARIIATANPNLEVIDVNEAKGTIKVRDKNSNKTLYLNLSDAKRGKLEFVDEDGKGVRLTGEGGNSKLEVTGEDGEKAVMTTGDGAQQGSWVPPYPGAKTLGSMNAQKKGKQSGVYTFETTDSPQQIIDFYKTKLTADGYTATTEGVSSEQMSSLQFTKEDREIHVVVTGHDAKTTVVVTYGAK